MLIEVIFELFDSMGMLLDSIKKSLAVFGIVSAGEEPPLKKSASTPSRQSHLMLPPTTTRNTKQPYKVVIFVRLNQKCQIFFYSTFSEEGNFFMTNSVPQS